MSKILNKIIKQNIKEYLQRNHSMDIFSEDVLLSLVYKEYKTMLYEGLILSYKLQTVISQLKRVYHINNIKIKNNKIIITIKNELNVITKNSKKFNKSLNVFGWYISGFHYISPLNDFKQTIVNKYSDLLNIKDIMFLSVMLEPKFDLFVDVSDILYHVSPKLYRNRILKKGLIPKSKNKMFNYPSRIYCFKNKNSYKELAIKLVEHMSSMDKSNLMFDDIIEYDLHKVNTNKLKIKWVKNKKF